MLGTRPAVVRFLMFHGIGGADYPTAAFRRLLLALSATSDVVPIDRAAELLDAGRMRGLPKVVLTFDDGLRNHHEVVYPLLRRMKMPATFYVCPGLVESGEWQWPHEARARLATLPPDERQAWAERFGASGTHADQIVECAKSLPSAHVRELVQQLREATPSFTATAEARQRCDVLGWDALRAMDPAIVQVGSHTMSHPIMTMLTPEELEHEVSASRAMIESRLQRPAEHFCYPNGANNEAVRQVVGRVYRTAVTVEPGNARSTTHRAAIPRVAASPTLFRTLRNAQYANRQRDDLPRDAEPGFAGTRRAEG